MSDSDELQGIIGGVDPEALQALMVSMPNASITSMYEGFLSMGEADKASIRAMGVDVESIQQSILTNPDLVESTREVAKNINPKDIAAAMKRFGGVTPALDNLSKGDPWMFSMAAHLYDGTADIGAVAQSHRRRDCASCGAIEGSVPGKRHAACNRCKTVFYCSRSCQSAHWKEGGHKRACETPEQREARLRKTSTPANAPATDIPPKEVATQGVAVDASAAVSAAAAVASADDGVSDGDKKAASASASASGSTSASVGAAAIAAAGAAAAAAVAAATSKAAAGAGAAEAEAEAEGEATSRTCAGCGSSEASSGKKHKPCSRCKTVFYCSVKCQKEHWRSGGPLDVWTQPHKEYCGGTGSDSDDSDDDGVEYDSLPGLGSSTTTFTMLAI